MISWYCLQRIFTIFFETHNIQETHHYENGLTRNNILYENMSRWYLKKMNNYQVNLQLWNILHLMKQCLWEKCLVFYVHSGGVSTFLIDRNLIRCHKSIVSLLQMFQSTAQNVETYFSSSLNKLKSKWGLLHFPHPKNWNI